jgi:cell division protein FtsI/penicillin-binding protein 2
MIREMRTRRRYSFCLTLVVLSLMTGGSLPDLPAAYAGPKPLHAARDPESPRHSIPVTLDKVHRRGKGYVADLDGGARAELTLSPTLQPLAEQLLTEHHAPYGAAVLLSVEDGKVLAMAGKSFGMPAKSTAELTMTPWAPAASVFKLVTASALVGKGVSPETRVCYHEGVHSVEASNLADHPRLDSDCNSLAYGLAKSQNAIFARLAHDHLEASALTHTAHALGFGEPLPFEVAIAPSTVEVPPSGLAFARVAAGFWQTTLSPMHGAWLAATLARGGVAPAMHIVDKIVRGNEVLRPEAASAHRVLDEKSARAVAAMMTGTTRYGTAKNGFHDARGRAFLPVTVAGKTGSLNQKEAPNLAYSWFVGFAPADKPEVAVAVLLGNGSARDARAQKLARELLQGYFHGQQKTLVATR